MTLKNLNYYGYTKDTYIRCLHLIAETDLHHAKILNIWFTFLSLAIFLLSHTNLFTVLAGNSLVYLSYFCIAVFLDAVFIVFSKKFNGWQTRFFVLFNIIVLISFSIYMSIIQPYMSAAIFPVILIILALTYIDTFFSMILIFLISSTFFSWTSYVFKPISITNVDVYNVLICLTLAFVMQYSFQRMRISRFVMYYENLDFQRNLEVRSSFDALTALLNRGRFFTIASEIIRNPHEEYIVLCLFDLDGFKQINDKLGHQMGDKAIQMTGKSLLEGFQIDFGEKWSFEERAVREKLSFAGRLGGDEFIVLLRGRKNREEVHKEAESILEKLGGIKAGELNGIHSSVGIAEISPQDHDIDNAYTQADAALYQSKESGKHMITFSKRM